MNNWKWRSLGQEFGPVEITALNKLAKNGTLGPDDEVCRGGSEQWLRVAAVPELQKSLHAYFEQRRCDFHEVTGTGQAGSRSYACGSGRTNFQTARRRCAGGTDASNRCPCGADDSSPVCLSPNAFDFVADQDHRRREHSLGLRFGCRQHLVLLRATDRDPAGRSQEAGLLHGF